MNISYRIIGIDEIERVRVQDVTDVVYVEQMNHAGMEATFQQVTGSDKPCLFLYDVFVLHNNDIQSLRYDSFLLFEGRDYLYCSFIPHTNNGYNQAIRALRIELTLQD
ncbi:hypothetical protein CAEBREN_13171 [Caenorhabditis brenneri]|uniref:Uncharacterized protein n=1 Tax=Caenorhabditis brenneri TaxID=135651 RepID=G0NXL0_CAEBE|nr:hypothetical protein CAEBREN_13171 [Caenorhabditis brenneri]